MFFRVARPLSLRFDSLHEFINDSGHNYAQPTLSGELIDSYEIYYANDRVITLFILFTVPKTMAIIYSGCVIYLAFFFSFRNNFFLDRTSFGRYLLNFDFNLTPPSRQSSV